MEIIEIASGIEKKAIEPLPVKYWVVNPPVQYNGQVCLGVIISNIQASSSPVSSTAAFFRQVHFDFEKLNRNPQITDDDKNRTLAGEISGEINSLIPLLAVDIKDEKISEQTRNALLKVENLLQQLESALLTPLEADKRKEARRALYQEQIDFTFKLYNSRELEELINQAERVIDQLGPRLAAEMSAALREMYTSAEARHTKNVSIYNRMLTILVQKEGEAVAFNLDFVQAVADKADMDVRFNNDGNIALFKPAKRAELTPPGNGNHPN